jgi:methyl-accepting chemotaxis protein
MSQYALGPATQQDTPPQSSHAWLAPAALALLATLCSALPLLAGDFNALTVLAPILAGTCTATGCWWLSRARRLQTGQPQHQASPLAHGPDDRPAELPHLLQGVLPVWHHHLVLTRTQIDIAANELLGSFASISDQFEAAGFTGTGAIGDQTEPAEARLARCDSDLQKVLALMNELMRSKERMSEGMKELANATKDLQSMAHGVGKIAAQTNLLAINAAIEAAHAGDSGRGFATIAKEIRGLSRSSEETASQISQRIARVTNIMDEASEAAEQSAQHEGHAIEGSRHAIESVLDHMRGLGFEAHTMRERGNVIRGDIEQLIISLQFQDRVNQQMSVVEGDITRLREHIESGQQLPSTQQWLTELQGHYTMREQRQSASTSVAATSNPVKPARKAVFF